MITMLCLLAGIAFFTRPRIQLPENPRIYEQRIHADGYAYLVYEDRIFVPYCPCEAAYLGECIGYYDTPPSEYSDAGRVYVCEMKGHDSGEWIIDILDMNCPEGMILRETSVTRIPEGLTSEYEWNK